MAVVAVDSTIATSAWIDDYCATVALCDHDLRRLADMVDAEAMCAVSIIDGRHTYFLSAPEMLWHNLYQYTLLPTHT